MHKQQSPRRGNMLALLISFVVSLGAIYLLFREVDFDEVIDQVQGADKRYLLLMLLSYPAAITARSFRWQHLTKEPIQFWHGFHIINIGFLLNAVLPFRAGEFARILLVSREPQQNMGAGLTAVSMERLFDLIMALTCVGVGLMLVPNTTALPPETVNALGFFIVATVIILLGVLFLPRTHPLILRVVRLLARPLPDAVAEKLLRFAEDTLANLRVLADPKRILVVLAWSALVWFMHFLYYYIGLFGFYESLPVGLGFLVLGFVAIGIAAPSLPGAIGVFQAAAVLALNTAGYETTAATGYAWTLWIAQTAVIVVFGVIGLWAMSLSFSGLTREVRAGMESPESLPADQSASATPE